jgi:AraC family transcriptional activator of pobA
MRTKEIDVLKVNDKIGPDKHYKIEPFRKEVRITKPHKHKQYFEIIYLSAGSGFHWIDEIQYEIKPPVIFFLNRDQMHHWELTDEPDGFVIILKKSFLERSKDNILIQFLQRVWFSDCLYLNDVAPFEQLLSLLVKQNNTELPYTLHAVDGLLKAFLAEILQLGKEHVSPKGAQLQLYSRYLDLVLTQSPLQRKVAFYSAQLKTTPQNLNAACRKAVDLSASEILNNQIISEAKRLLVYTNNYVGEIAYSLNFKDPSYFVKFFKKMVKQTPEEFRKVSFQNHH